MTRARLVRLVTALLVTAASLSLAGGTASAKPAPHKHRAVCGPRGNHAARCHARIETLDDGKTPVANASPATGSYGPADLQSAYNLPSASAGSGQTIAIVDAFDDPYAETDLANYRVQYGLSACTTANGCFQKVDQNGGHNYPAFNSGWAREEPRDIQ